MIESPLIEELPPEKTQETVSTVLQTRVGELPPKIKKLRAVRKEKRPDELLRSADVCPNPEADSQIVVLQKLGPLLFDRLKRTILLESPLIKEILAEKLRDVILDLLEARFGPVPPDVTKRLR